MRISQTARQLPSSNPVLDSLDIENMSLKEAILASVGGNVIDLATPSEFDLVEEFTNISSYISLAISDALRVFPKS